MGFEIFDKTSWGETEFDEKVNYQRALEGELERTIQGLRNVESARVHLVLPAESVFLDRQRTAKASVILKLRRGGLQPEAQQTIARLVAGAVDGLSENNVAVMDADTNRPLDGARGEGPGGLGEHLTQRLLATLAPVVGAEHVRASVNVEYDPSTTEESQERYDPASTVTLAMQKSEERIGSGTGVGGVPGTSSNVPGAKPDSANGDLGGGNQNTKTESATYGVNKTVRRTSEPAGRLKRITAALLVDDQVETKSEGGKTVTARKKWSPEELKQVQELAQAALGTDTARGDLVTVENISFDVPAPQVVPPVPKMERLRTLLQDWSSLLRYLLILLLFLATYALVIRPLKRQAVKTMKELPARSSRAAVTAGAEAQSGTVIGAPPDELIEAQQKAKQLKKQVLDKVRHEPVPSSRLVQAWLRED
jgi:flagellar M-ring protein FliF